MKNPRTNALRWIRDAENTLRQGEMNCRMEAYNVACFLAEQSAQKSLKAVRYLDGSRFISTHSVTELIREISEKRPEFLPMRPQAAVREQYYLTTRYPDAVAEPAIPSEIFTKKQADEALRIARTIFEMSKQLIF